MLDSVHDTTESKSWMPNVCPQIHTAYGPLQTMQASSALGHCVSVKPIMPPSYLTTKFSCSCTWSCVRRTASQHYIVKVIHRQTTPSFNMHAPHPGWQARAIFESPDLRR